MITFHNDSFFLVIANCQISLIMKWAMPRATKDKVDEKSHHLAST